MLNLVVQNIKPEEKVDKRRQLPNNFVYAGSTQSVSNWNNIAAVDETVQILGENHTATENSGKC